MFRVLFWLPFFVECPWFSLLLFVLSLVFAELPRVLLVVVSVVFVLDFLTCVCVCLILIPPSVFAECFRVGLGVAFCVCGTPFFCFVFLGLAFRFCRGPGVYCLIFVLPPGTAEYP